MGPVLALPQWKGACDQGKPELMHHCRVRPLLCRPLEPLQSAAWIAMPPSHLGESYHGHKIALLGALLEPCGCLEWLGVAIGAAVPVEEHQAELHLSSEVPLRRCASEECERPFGLCLMNQGRL